MSTPSCSSLRRIGALVIIPMIMLLGACGTKYDLTIHGDTVDQTILMWDSKDQMTEDNCSKEGMASAGVNPADDVPEGVDVKYTFTDHDGHPACEIKATNVPLSQFDGKGGPGGSERLPGIDQDHPRERALRRHHAAGRDGRLAAGADDPALR